MWAIVMISLLIEQARAAEAATAPVAAGRPFPMTMTPPYLAIIDEELTE
jgi:hypothetical protein